MSSKLREAARSSAESASRLLNNTETVNAIEDIQNFASVIGVSENSAADADRNQQQNENHLKENNEQRKVDKAKDTDSTEKAVPKKTKKEEEHELDDAETQELEDHKVNVDELARQLQVVLGPQNREPVQSEVIAEIKEVAMPQQALNQVQTEINEVDSELLKKIDVKTIQEKLDAVLKNDEANLLETEVPEDISEAVLESKPQEVAKTVLEQMLENTADQNSILPSAGEKNELDSLSQKELKAVAQSDLKDIPVSEEVMEFFSEEVQDLESKSDSDLWARINDSGPDDLFDMVSTYINSESVNEALVDSDSLFSVIELLGEKDSLVSQDGIMDFVIDSFQKMEGQLQGASSVDLSSGTQNLFDKNSFAQSFMKPVYDKVNGVVIQMAKNGKSGMTRIQIHPPELGSVNIKFQVKGDMVKVEIVTQNEATKHLLEQHVSKLADILTSEKLSVDKLEVKHDRDFFEEPQQKMVSEYALKNGGEPDHQKGFYGSAAREEMYQRMQMMIANRRAQRGLGKYNFSV